MPEPAHKYTNTNSGEDLLRASLSRSLAMTYALGHSVSEYLRSRRHLDVAVVTSPNDYGLAEQVCLDLVAQVDIYVRSWISEETFDSPRIRQNLIPPTLHFSPKNACRIGKGTTVLLLTTGKVPSGIGEHVDRAKRVVSISDLVEDLLTEVFLTKGLRKVREAHPGVPVLLWNEPQFPRSGNLSDIENRMVLEGTGHYVSIKMVDDIQKNGTIPLGFRCFDYSSDQLVEMLTTYPSRLSNGMLAMEDHSSELVTISDGHRKTPGQPVKPSRTIWLFGGCMVFGVGCPDHGTLAAALLRYLGIRGHNEFRVENWGTFVGGRERFMYHRMANVPISADDIIVLGLPAIGGSTLPDTLPEGCYTVDMLNVFQRPHPWGESIFFDGSHPHQHGQTVMALKIAEALEVHSYFENRTASAKLSQSSGGVEPCTSWKEQLNDYCRSLATLRPAVGAIVMNCNPFTLGHQFLIERCASKCDRLYIFVVEENRSFFPFQDRLRLVRAGTAHLDNVTVLPSGQYIISSVTFADYFGKADLQDQTIDPTLDVEIFADHIAPSLGITVRFAGDEPIDRVTRQYNEAMARVLPTRGIRFEVLDRIEVEGDPISASRVRALLEDLRFEDIAALVPASTLDYLIQRFAEPAIPSNAGGS